MERWTRIIDVCYRPLCHLTRGQESFQAEPRAVSRRQRRAEVGRAVVRIGARDQRHVVRLIVCGSVDLVSASRTFIDRWVRCRVAVVWTRAGSVAVERDTPLPFRSRVVTPPQAGQLSWTPTNASSEPS